MTVNQTRVTGPWHDTTLPTAERVEALIAEMTVPEKVAQLYGIWVGASADGEDVAPNQHEMSEEIDLDVLLPRGLGQLTRPFGTAPVDPAVGAVSLMRTQQRILDSSRFGIPAMAHEECLAGFAAWQATAYPIPLSWGASFNPSLTQRMAERIGADMAALGIHQGLAPLLDVVRDHRWGRVEETIGEDPYLVGTIASAYVRGLESSGVVATLKHFVGYSASKAGRNLAPVSIGPRELADVLLPPFEMAVRDSGVGSVMNSYTDNDGLPAAANQALLTGLLRDTWGFDGTVVADYFAIGFLHLHHRIAADYTEAAELALKAGIDVELPSVKAFNGGLVTAVETGRVDEALLDRALRRVLRQKARFGMLDPGWSPTPPALEGVDTSDVNALRGTIDLDPAPNRELARQVAEEAVVLVSNDGTLPLGSPRHIAVIGPNADNPHAVFGCYSFPLHVGVRYPDLPMGLAMPTLREALAEEFPEATISYAQGTSIDGGELDGLHDAISAAAGADVVVLALGDRAGLFGRGTSGEGCDAEDLTLPGAQRQLLDAVLATGTPTVVVMLAGRPYVLGAAVEQAGAILEAFFLGEEGTTAVAGVLSGRVNPSGRLPVSIPATPGIHPSTYLAAPLARRNGVSNVDPTPAFPFGHGLGYTRFAWTDASATADRIGTDGSVTVSIRVENAGARAGAEVVQLYLHDPYASVVRPVRTLIGYQKVWLEPGERVTVSFEVHADLTSFTGVAGHRIVEPGLVELQFGRSAADIVAPLPVTLAGSVRAVDHTRVLYPTVSVLPA